MSRKLLDDLTINLSWSWSCSGPPMFLQELSSVRCCSEVAPHVVLPPWQVPVLSSSFQQGKQLHCRTHPNQMNEPRDPTLPHGSAFGLQNPGLMELQPVACDFRSVIAKSCKKIKNEKSSLSLIQTLKILFWTWPRAGVDLCSSEELRTTRVCLKIWMCSVVCWLLIWICSQCWVKGFCYICSQNLSPPDSV